MQSRPSLKVVFLEAFGWYGAVVILATYALVSFDLIGAHTLLYQVLNCTGAFGIIAVSLYKRVYQSVMLNVIWAIIAIIAIIDILR